MNILILTGSPRPNGNSHLLAERFAEGAKAAGHTVTRLDTAHLDVHPCIACEHCHNGSGTCTFHDGFTDIRRAIAKADAIVFAAPIYYFGLPAQLIAAIDRFYACGDDLKFPKKAALIVTILLLLGGRAYLSDIGMGLLISGTFTSLTYVGVSYLTAYKKK